MRFRWLMIGTVVGVAVLIDLVVFPWYELWHHRWSYIPATSITQSHGSLLAVWVAFGGKGSPWRLVAAVVGAIAWIWIEYNSEFRSDMPVEIIITSAQMVMSSALLLIARLLGLELADVLRIETAPNVPSGRPWVQFSLRSLLSWTAALAVMLGMLHYLPSELVFHLRDPFELSAIFSGRLLVVLGALWIALGTRWPTVRIMVMALTVAAALATWYLVAGQAELWEFLLFYHAQAAYLVGSLWLIRLAGYRLVWRRRVAL